MGYYLLFVCLVLSTTMASANELSRRPQGESVAFDPAEKKYYVKKAKGYYKSRAGENIFQGIEVHAADLRKICGTSDALTFRNCIFPDISLDIALQRARPLRLNFENCKFLGKLHITNANTRVDTVRISGCDADDNSLGFIEKFPNLLVLDIADTPITGAFLLSEKSAFSNLNVLIVKNSFFNDENLLHIKKLPKLEILDLSETPCTAEGFAKLGELNKLKALRVPFRSDPDNWWRVLLKVTNLTGNVSKLGLDFDNCSFSDAALMDSGVLDHFYLNFSGTNITDRGLKGVRFKNLTGLNLANCAVSGETLNHTTTPDLVKLNLANTKPSTNGLRNIAALKRLILLDLSNSLQGNEQPLQYLRGATMQALFLARNSSLSPSDLTMLKDCPHLSILDLSQIYVFPELLRELRTLPHLTELHLDGCRNLDSRCLLELGQLTELKTLSVIDTGLSQRELNQLRKQLNNCNVSSQRTRPESWHYAYSLNEFSNQE